MPKQKDYDIGIIGDLALVDFNTAKSLAELGVKVVVFRKKSAAGQEIVDDFYQEKHLGFEIYNYSNPVDFFKKACTCAALFSFTGAVLGPLKTIYPLSLLPAFPPVVNIATGSDMLEFVAEKSIKAFLFRMHLRLSAMNWIVDYPHSLKNAVKFKIPRVYLMPFPAFRLPEERLDLPAQDGTIIFFHPSHLDWQATDNKNERYSSKGNDRFIRAFIRAVKSGLNAKCTLLYRGADKDLAKKMIQESGVADSFILKDALSRDELFEEFAHCHVVVDQFDVGGLGGIAIEAMAAGRPVMMYVNENCSRLQYGGDTPPVINCWSEDEIYGCLMGCAEASFIHEKSEQSYSWVHRQHRTDVVYDKILFYIYLLTGKKFKDYGWKKNAYKN